jgi:hypothetical protein
MGVGAIDAKTTQKYVKEFCNVVKVAVLRHFLQRSLKQNFIMDC